MRVLVDDKIENLYLRVKSVSDQPIAFLVALELDLSLFDEFMALDDSAFLLKINNFAEEYRKTTRL